MSTWPAPSIATPVHATVTVPGSKSQTNRALILAALAADGKLIKRPLVDAGDATLVGFREKEWEEALG